MDFTLVVRQCKQMLANEIVGDNLDAETAPFSFKLKAGEELCGSALTERSPNCYSNMKGYILKIPHAMLQIHNHTIQ